MRSSQVSWTCTSIGKPMIPARQIQSMRQSLEKQATVQPAAPGSGEKYMPWYGAAAGGLAGSQLASKFLPKKYRAAGQMAGTLLGTAVGVHGGEAVGRKLDQAKTAEEKKRDTPAKVLGRSLGGLALGSAVGTAVPYVLDKGLERYRGRGLMSPTTAMKVGPVVGGILGVATPLFHHEMSRRMIATHKKNMEEDRGGQRP